MAKGSDYWRSQKRDPVTGRWIDTTPGDVLDPSIRTAGRVQLRRTNAKPEGGGLGKPVDLPKFDVMAGEEKIGEVYAALSKPEHISQGGGSHKLWYYRKPGGRTSPGMATQKNARDALLSDISHSGGSDEVEAARVERAAVDVMESELRAESEARAPSWTAEELETLRSVNTPAPPKVSALKDYRTQVRGTFQRMSDQALEYQSGVVKGGIDQEELDREVNRRRFDGGTRVDDKTSVKITLDWYNSPTLKGEGMSGAGPSEYYPREGTQFMWKGEIWEVIASGEKGWIPAVPENVAREIENLREHITSLIDSGEYKTRPELMDDYSRQISALTAPYDAESPDFKYGTVELELVGRAAKQMRDQYGMRKAIMDLDTMYYEAAFDSVEAQLQRRGMNTTNASDETLRMLEKAEKEMASKIPDRGKLSDDQFALPDERRYPIPDEAHGRLALGRCKGKPEEDTVRAAVVKKYPQLKEYAAEVLDG